LFEEQHAATFVSRMKRRSVGLREGLQHFRGQAAFLGLLAHFIHDGLKRTWRENKVAKPEAQQ
jgi:hypothetical protein